MVKKVSDDTKRAILNKSAFALPDRPSEAGIPATTVKKAFYAPITDNSNSVLAELDRVVDEVNRSLETGGVEVDTTPTEGSGKPVTSGGVYTAIREGVEEANAYADAQEAAAVGAARSYTDSQIGVGVNNAKSYTDTKVADALKSARSYTDDVSMGKQDALIAGEGITIINNVISSTGGGGGASSGGSEVTGVKNKIASYTVNNTSVSVSSNSATLFEIDLNELPISSVEEILSFDVAYRFSNKQFLETVHFYRDSNNYRRFIGCGQLTSLSLSELFNFGMVGSETVSAQAQAEIPPIELRIMTSQGSNGVYPVTLRFARNSAGIGIGWFDSGMVDPVSMPPFTQSAGMERLTFTRIDINYLAAELEKGDDGDGYPTEMTLYGMYFEMSETSGYFYVTAPVGFALPEELQQWLIDCGYTSPENGCPVSDCFYGDEYMWNAVIYADANGIYVNDAVVGWGGFLENIYDFYDSNQP